jgi:hypothetical protein
MRSIIIDPEFRDLIPPLAPQELEQLHNSLCGDGCLSPLIVWQEEQILVDGHNRHAWLTKHDRPFDIKEMSFSNREEVRRFIILNQLGRRNVTPETASMLRAEYHASMSKGVGAPKGNKNAGKQKTENQAIVSVGEKTADIVAKETGVSRATVEADVRLVKALDKLGIPRADYAAGKVRDTKGKKRSKASILAEAFPPKEKPKVSPPPAPVEPDESEAAEDDAPLMQSIVIKDDEDELPQAPEKPKPEPELESWTIILTQLPKITKQQRQELFEILARRWDCKPAR